MKVGNPSHPLASKFEEFENKVDSNTVHESQWRGRLEDTNGNAGNDSGRPEQNAQAATQTNKNERAATKTPNPSNRF